MSAVRGVRPIAQSRQSTVRVAAGRVGERERAVGVLVDARDLALALNLHALRHHLLVEHAHHLGVKRAQERLVANVERRLRAETAKNAGELDRDVAGADDGDASRALIQLEEAVRRNAVLSAGHVAGHVGAPPVATTMCLASKRSASTATVRASSSLPYPAAYSIESFLTLLE
jgi:hypothetical protein